MDFIRLKQLKNQSTGTMCSKYLIVLISILSLVSCTDGELKHVLDELDRTIESRQYYQNKFEASNDSLKFLLAVSPDRSRSCGIAEQLFDAYKHFNLDSAAKFNQIEKMYAVSFEQEFKARCNEIYETASRGAQRIAIEKFFSIDTVGLPVNLKILYHDTGIELMKNKPEYRRELMNIRRGLVLLDTLSYIGRKNLANLYRSNGQTARARDVFEVCLKSSTDEHERISIMYNIANLWGESGNRLEKEIWLARTAINDFKSQNRDYQSLYHLSLMLFDDGDLARAARYINIHYDDVSNAYFFPRIQTSGTAERKIISSYLSTVKSRQLMLVIGIVVIVVLSIIISVLYRNNAKKKNALQKAHEELTISDKIKENYIFRYMLLSLHYMDEATSNRHEYRRILKDYGPEALMKVLRSEDKEYSAQKEFYSFFDEAFLNIYPDFVEEVNSMLPPENRHDAGTRNLTTELRILAVMRLGISSSSDIAKFLKCSLPTVYTYRAKLRNLAICDKTEFDRKICRKDL